MTRVFVYGSLRRGGWNHGLLQDSKFIGQARTAGRCALYACPVSGLPYLTTEGVSRVTGEVFEVSDEVLADIDSLEGHPESYCRLPVDIEMLNGAIIEAEAYFWLNEITDLELVPSGDWFDAVTLTSA